MRSALLWLAVTGWTAAAQQPFVVRGTLAAGERVEVLLLDEIGMTAARAISGMGGRFELAADLPGHYQLAIRSGGQVRVLDRFELTSAQPVVELRAARPGPFDPGTRQPRTPADPVISAGRLARPIPRAARRSYERAIQRKAGGDVEGARKLLEKAVAAAPDYAEALNDLAVLYIRREDYSRAERALQRAVEADPSGWRARLNLGIVRLSQKNYGAARAEMERAQSLAGDSPLPAFHLARLHLAEGRSGQAEASYSRALRIDPTFAAAQLFRGYLRLLRGDLEAGRADLAAYLKLQPKAADAGEVRARLEIVGAAIQKQSER